MFQKSFGTQVFFVLQTFTNRSRNLQRQKPFQNESNESNLRKKKSMATEIESPIKQVQGWRNVSVTTKVSHKVDSRQNYS